MKVQLLERIYLGDRLVSHPVDELTHSLAPSDKSITGECQYLPVI